MYPAARLLAARLFTERANHNGERKNYQVAQHLFALYQRDNGDCLRIIYVRRPCEPQQVRPWQLLPLQDQVCEKSFLEIFRRNVNFAHCQIN